MRIAKSDETRQMTWAIESQNRVPDPTICPIRNSAIYLLLNEGRGLREAREHPSCQHGE